MAAAASERDAHVRWTCTSSCPPIAREASASKRRVRLAMDHIHDHVWVVLGLCLITVAFFGFILWHQQTVVLPERNRQLRAERAKNRIEKLA